MVSSRSGGFLNQSRFSSSSKLGPAGQFGSRVEVKGCGCRTAPDNQCCVRLDLNPTHLTELMLTVCPDARGYVLAV